MQSPSNLINAVRHSSVIFPSLRQLSTSTRLFEPGFINTLKEAGKPPLTASIPITRPIGYALPQLLNPPKPFSLLGFYTSLMLPEARLRRQKRLDHDVRHSPFYESKSFNNTNGKIFSSPQSYFQAARSLYFPEFSSKTLETTRRISEAFPGKVLVVKVYSTILGAECAELYVSKLEQNPTVQIIDVNVPANWAKLATVYALIPSLRKSIPHDRHNLFFIVSPTVFDFEVRQKLLCDNTCGGYVYVVDGQGKIRWAASGNATEKDQHELQRIVNALKVEEQTSSESS